MKNLSLKEKVKYIITVSILNLLKLLWIIPINNKKILFLSFDGKQYSDSPKYICGNIDKNKYHIVWALNEPDKLKKELSSHIITVKRHSLKFIIDFITSKAIVTNNFVPTYLPVRKNQILLNTWHGGSPLKTVGFTENKVEPYTYVFFKLQNKKYNAFLSSSVFVTNDVLGKSFRYTGKILEFGMPRNAILFQKNNQIRKKVCKKYGIEYENGIALYAPTFRGNFKNGDFLQESQMLNINTLIQELDKKFNKKFTLLFRAHHTMKFELNNIRCKNATDYPDMQELLYAADILITDYSSCMGDMCLMNKPVFLYVPDLNEYISDRGFYWNIYDLPFPVATNNFEMSNAINNFNEKIYRSKVRKYLENLGSFENDKSIEKTCQWLVNEMERSK